MKKKYIREELDFVITDLLPLEKSNILTNRFFYDFLQNNKKKLDKLIIQKKTLMNKGRIFDKSWHSAPLTFKVRNKKSTRDISLINPLGIVESIIYKSLYYDTALSIIHKNNIYGIRTPHHKASMTLRTPKKKIVKYSSEKEKKQIQLSLESSGFFYHHKPFSTIIQYQNSNSYNYCLDKYKYLAKIDIQNFFPSIYTHTFSWIIANDTFNRKNLNSSSSIYSVTDVFLQNLNSSKTNGVLVGAEIFRFISEFLLVHLDEKIQTKLSTYLKENSKYKIIRFIDDYFIFYDSEEEGLQIIKTIESILGEFHLQINQSKTVISKTSEIYNLWFVKINYLLESINKIFDSNCKKKLVFSNFRQEINDLISSCPNDVDRIVSYLLTVFVNKVEEMKNKELVIKMTFNDYVNLIIYIYAQAPSYLSTQKLIRILELLLNYNELEFKFVIEKAINRYYFKIEDNAYINDFVNIITFLAKHNIMISNVIENKIYKLMKDEDNILILANYAIIQTEEDEFEELNKIIYKNISKINWEEFFLDNRSWWVFIFFSWPNLSIQNKTYLSEKLCKLKQVYKDCYEKCLIIEFLLNENKHFIDWNFIKDDESEFYFYTRNRTVFNPKAIDSLSISF